MKKLSLDLGDVWVGSALSDTLGITCKPYQTVHVDELELFLKKTLTSEEIDGVVVGYPKTMRGEKSEQTKKTELIFNDLKKRFSRIAEKSISWYLWDERLSSKRAHNISNYQHKTLKEKKEGKRKEHSVAAAFILQSYLDRQAV